MLLFVLASCSKTTINAQMYEINDFKCEVEINDYFYEILNNYDDYCENVNYNNIHDYSKDYFLNSSLVIIYIRDSTNANKYALKEIVKNINKLEISVERTSQGISQVFSTVSYCVEIECKNVKKVEIIKV